VTTTIGVDLGGTKLAALLVDAEGQIRHRVWREHGTTGYEQVLELVLDAVRECAGAAWPGTPVTGVGVAVAGPISQDRERVLAAPNLGFRDRPMRLDLVEQLQTNVILENDANAAAYAEYRYGAGIGARSLVIMMIGTGIGGGIVIDGRVLTGGRGAAAELGHLPLVPDGIPCVCGSRGCMEQYASGTAIARQAADEIAAGNAPGIAALVPPGEAVTSRHVVTAAAADTGDQAAVRILAEAGVAIGRGLAMIAPTIDPDVVVLGGGLAHSAAPYFLSTIDDTVARHASFRAQNPPPRVRLSACGPDAGAIGAAALAAVPAPTPVP
jgi:glucokinase